MNRFLYLGDIHIIGEFLNDFIINLSQLSDNPIIPLALGERK
jgi:hypothetical protein